MAESNRVYVYNKVTKSVRWLTTKEGDRVTGATDYHKDDIDDPNPKQQTDPDTDQHE